MDVLDRLAELGGVARRSQLGAGAADLRAIEAARGAGQVCDLGAGWIALAEVPAAVVAARRLNGAVTCISAAPFYGLATIGETSGAHVAVPRRRGLRPVPAPTRVHRETHWTRPSQMPPVAPIAEVLSRVLRCQPARSAIVTVDSALNKELVTVDEVAALLEGPGSVAALAALDRANSRSRSGIETLARLALEDAGLRTKAGVLVSGVGEVDLLVEDWVVVECDGFAYHSGRREYREDRRRDRVLSARGYVVLRFTWEEIMRDPEIVAVAVRSVLDRERKGAASDGRP